MDLKRQIVEFLKQHPYPKDELIHKFAESKGIAPDKVEEATYSILSDLFSQGDSIENPKSIKKQSLNKGMAVEEEHTTNPDISEKIAKDHLTEASDYYDKLKLIEGTDSMKSLKEILKAKGKPISGVAKDAKLGLMKELQKVMGDEMSSELPGLKKVSVAAPSKEGLEKGLEKAKEMLGEMPEGQEKEDEEGEEGAEHEASESPEQEASEDEGSEDESSEEEGSEEMSPQEMKEKLAELEREMAELKAKLK